MIASEAYWIHLATSAVEIVGTAIIVVGAFGTLAAFLTGMAGGTVSRATLVADFRSGLGRSILLGLEFLVAADIINTVAVEPTIESLLVLAGIVLIRTFLSFSLEVEIDGRWPWQKGRSDETTPRDEDQNREESPRSALQGRWPARHMPRIGNYRFRRRSGG